jgi:protein TonB
MTHPEVGSETRSEIQERVRFIWALAFSGLLHAVVLTLPAGPPPGTRMTSAAAAGGVIEASLRRAAPDPAPSPSLPTPLASQTPTPGMPLIAIMVMPTTSPTLPVPSAAPVSASAPPPATSSSGTAPVDSPNQSAETSAETNAAAGDGNDNSFAIPLLPPLGATARELPRRPSLLAPVSFSYPRDVRLQGGRVRVRILLDDKGRVEDMRVVNAVPPGVFDRTALSVLRSARYAPGFAGPTPLRSYLFMEVTFGPGPYGQQVWYAGSAIVPPGS